MRTVAQEDSGRVGKRTGNAAVEEAHLAKELDLAVIERVRRNLRTCQMAHQQ